MIDFLSYETVALFKMNNILSWIAPFMKFYTASLNSHLTASLASLIVIIMIFFTLMSAKNGHHEFIYLCGSWLT